MKSKSQQVKGICLTCKKESEKVLCNTCSKNPFSVEAARIIAARNGSDEIFRSLYSKNYAEIKNINNRNFWDKKFNNKSQLIDQDRMTKDKIKILVSFLSPSRTQLLDLGFGQGYLEEEVVSNNIRVDITGIDISKAAVTRAKRKFKGRFIHGNLDNIEKKFKKNSFDIVSAVEVLEHVSPSKIFNLYKKIYNILKKNGTLLISVPINEGLSLNSKNPSGHVRSYSPEILVKELEMSGFRVLSTHVLYAFENNYLLKSKIAKILKNRWKPNSLIVKAIKN